MSGYAKGLSYLLSDLGNESGPLLDWRESGRTKRGDDFLYEKGYSVSEAVSDLIGKASIHPEKVSLTVNMSFNFRVVGMCMKSIGQSFPGICPQA